VAGFLKDFLPELMRCLPDWAEVEGQEQSKQAAATTGSQR